MDSTTIQVKFFQHVRTQLAPHLSLVDEIADLLNISNDSAYRRIRGEKPISFEELQILSSHYRISLDQFLHLQNNSIIFSGHLADAKNFGVDLYLQHILKTFQHFTTYEKREIFYMNKDVPIFHHFAFRELAAFKYYFWMRTILHNPQYAKAKFLIDDFMEPLLETGQKIIESYTDIPSVEIWNIENIHVTIRQIEYYKDTNVFSSDEDLLAIYNCLEQCINHIERQAEAGYKFNVKDEKAIKRGSYKVYFNEFIIGDNTALVLLNDTKLTWINHGVMNFMNTHDACFSEYTYQHFQNIIHKSTLISDVGEKERSRFFNRMREKIDGRKRSLVPGKRMAF